MKSEPRPGVHSAHFELEVSTVTERIASEVAFRAPALNKLDPALTGCHCGESPSADIDSSAPRCLCSLYIRQREANLLQANCAHALT